MSGYKDAPKHRPPKAPTPAEKQHAKMLELMRLTGFTTNDVIAFIQKENEKDKENSGNWEAIWEALMATMLYVNRRVEVGYPNLSFGTNALPWTPQMLKTGKLGRMVFQYTKVLFLKHSQP